MASPPPNWALSKEEIEAAIGTSHPLLNSFLDRMITAEHEHIEKGIRHALGRWVSELEPVLMYRMGKTRPYGVTAKGHNESYVDIEWDDNFYPGGPPADYPVRLYSRT